MTDGAKSRRSPFVMADGISDNLSFMEFVEEGRRVLHAGALELGITASELQAKLRRANRGITVGGMTARYRAAYVTRPIGQAAEALVIASKYIITSGNRFEAVYGYELEHAGAKRRESRGFEFKAG